MAEVRLNFNDPTDGFPCPHDPAVDTVTFAGITLNGDIVAQGNRITGLPDAASGSEPVTLSQLQAIQDGLDYKESVRVTAKADLGAVFDAAGGAAGRGQFTSAPTTVDGIGVNIGDRILVQGQSSAEQNGIYVVIAAGTWDRATDFDDDADVSEGATVWVGEGTTCADTRFTLATNDPITVNTTGLMFAQTAGGSILGGDGIDVTAGVVSVDLAATSCLQFVAGELSLLVDPAGGLECTPTGLAARVGMGIEIDGSNQIAVDLAATNPGLQFVAGELALLPDPAGAVVVGAAGAAVQVDGVTIQINGSNQLEVIGSGQAERLCNTYVAQAAVAAGQPVFQTSTNNEVAEADASVRAASTSFVGVAKAAAGVGANVEVATDGLVLGALTGTGITAGQPVYIAVGGGLTSTRPTGAGNSIMYLGRAKNADDLTLQPQYLGKASA